MDNLHSDSFCKVRLRVVIGEERLTFVDFRDCDYLAINLNLLPLSPGASQ